MWIFQSLLGTKDDNDLEKFVGNEKSKKVKKGEEKIEKEEKLTIIQPKEDSLENIEEPKQPTVQETPLIQEPISDLNIIQPKQQELITKKSKEELEEEKILEILQKENKTPTESREIDYYIDEDNLIEETEETDVFEKVEKKEEVSESLDVKNLVEKQHKVILGLSETLGVSISVCGALLRAYQWKKEKLVNQFFEDSEKVLKKAGIDPKFLHESQFNFGSKDETFECSVCMDDLSGDQMISLSCKHFLCKGCWKGFLTSAINQGPSCLNKTCPYPKCNTLCNESIFKEIVDKETYKKYNKYLINSFIDDNPDFKWCPNPSCGKIVTMKTSLLKSVKCSCGTSFCFKCGDCAHDPLDCSMLLDWRKKCKDDSATANYIVTNTKPCPKCKKNIEKNGGCNYMGCTCGYGFCWVCLGPHDHNMSTHKCQVYTDDKNVEDTRKALEKYMFYFSRYENHANSQKLEGKLREMIMKNRIELVSKGIENYGNSEYLETGFDTLISCRNVLKFTYPFCYYLKQGKEKDLFEYSQQDLESFTEKLSYLLEKNPKDKNSILSISKVALVKLDFLIKGTNHF